MPLRCLLFCSDQEATNLVVRVLAELRIDAEHCPNAIMATERVTSQPFQFVILDWDDQPDAGLLLSAARTRKAAERPLTLAMVGEDTGVPKALQAGANSILRKPILVNQVRDTLTTARDLLRAKLEQSASTAKAVAAKASASPAPALEFSSAPANLRAGEFLQSGAPQPGAQFITDADVEKGMLHEQAPAVIDPLQDLEPMAAALEPREKTPAVVVAPAASQPRGLAWYKARSAATGSGAAAAASPALAPVPAGGFASALPRSAGKTELLGYDQTPSNAVALSEKPAPSASAMSASAGIEPLEIEPSSPAAVREESDQKNETALFAYMAGEQAEQQPTSPTSQSPSRFRPVLITICAVAICTGVVYLTVPQKLWKPGLERQSARIARAVHAWLNPQPVAPPQVPATHESFARAGDEYKMPVAEAIPDATTDPSQIHVLPVIDPTAKQPHTGSANASQGADSQSPNIPDQAPAMAGDGVASAANPDVASPTATASRPAAQPQPATAAPAATVTSAPPKPSVVPPARQPNRQAQFTAVNVGIPSSLKSQMAASTPDPGGNKSPDAAMPSIEPVAISEAAARNLLVQQPAPAYPESAKGQSGTVILQVLIGRDGSVQDAKFMQGSLVFARAAIDAVRQWHFQPYTMNGRPASTVTSLTVSFRPAS